MMRFEKFTKQSQDAAARIYELLEPNDGKLVETVHLLYALLESSDGLITRLLIEMKVDVGELVGRLEDVLVANRNNYKNAKQIFITPQIKQILDLANEEANRLNDEYISTWHLFLAILSERNTVVSKIITDYGIRRSEVYDAIIRRRNARKFEKTIFVSYRRKTSMRVAREVFKDLVSHGYDVFLDIRNRGDARFDQIGLNQITARNYFILILSPNSLLPCVDERDLLRQEIEKAIRAKRNAIVIMEEQFSLTDELKYLPLNCQETLVKCPFIRLQHNQFEANMESVHEQLLTHNISGDVEAINEDEQEIVRQIIANTINTVNSE